MEKVENLKEVKTLYKIVCDRELATDEQGVLRSIEIIRYLERTTHQNFANKKDFYDKMNQFIYAQEALITAAAKIEGPV